jgi:hypothetical protein
MDLYRDRSIHLIEAPTQTTKRHPIHTDVIEVVTETGLKVGQLVALKMKSIDFKKHANIDAVRFFLKTNIENGVILIELFAPNTSYNKHYKHLEMILFPRGTLFIY